MQRAKWERQDNLSALRQPYVHKSRHNQASRRKCAHFISSLTTRRVKGRFADPDKDASPSVDSADEREEYDRSIRQEQELRQRLEQLVRQSQLALFPEGLPQALQTQQLPLLQQLLALPPPQEETLQAQAPQPTPQEIPQQTPPTQNPIDSQ